MNDSAQVHIIVEWRGEKSTPQHDLKFRYGLVDLARCHSINQ
jgi:hypothetical protein